MGTRRHKPEGIVTKPTQVKGLYGQGMLQIDAIRPGPVNRSSCLPCLGAASIHT